MSVDPGTFRTVMSRMPTGVTVVWAGVGEEAQGLTVGSFCSVSLEPPLVLICLRQDSSSHDFIDGAGGFTVSILGEDQEDVARRFADSSLSPMERLDEVEWRPGASGAPILEEAIAWLECRLESSHPAGDHSIFVGRVVALGTERETAPLVFYDRRYGMPGAALPHAAQ